MGIIRTIKILSNYYQNGRGLGSTTLMKRGTSNYEYDKLILVSTHSSGKSLGFKPHEMVSLNSIDRLRGSDLPLAIDNHTLIDIFDQVSLKLEEQEDRATRAESNAVHERLRREDLAVEIKEMKENPFRTLIDSLWRH